MPSDPAFAPRAESVELVPEQAFTLSAAAFKQRFALSPLLRARRGGYLRNLAVVLGNRGAAEYARLLENASENDEDALVREHARWALEQINA